MKGCPLSPMHILKIRELDREGTSASDIASAFSVHVTTIYRILKAKKKKKSKKGRPPKLTKLERLRLINKFRKNPRSTARQVAMSKEFAVSERTINRELKKAGYQYKRITPRKTLTENHKEKRRNFAISHAGWTSSDWGRVVFTDEKRWNLSGNDGYIPIWTKDKKNDYKLTETNLKKGIMVWGAISRDGGLRLICMEGKINAESYIDMLERDFWHEVQDSLPDNLLWMHDNAPPHVSFKTREYLERKRIISLKWPAMSPDLNPIENVWGLMSQTVYEGKKTYKNTTDLWEAVKAAWYSIPVGTICNLYDSLPGRIIKVIEEKGERISY